MFMVSMNFMKTDQPVLNSPQRSHSISSTWCNVSTNTHLFLEVHRSYTTFLTKHFQSRYSAPLPIKGADISHVSCNCWRRKIHKLLFSFKDHIYFCLLSRLILCSLSWFSERSRALNEREGPAVLGKNPPRLFLHRKIHVIPSSCKSDYTRTLHSKLVLVNFLNLWVAPSSKKLRLAMAFDRQSGCRVAQLAAFLRPWVS